MSLRRGLSLELKLPLATSALLLLLLGLYTWIAYQEVAQTTRSAASERDSRLAKDLAELTTTSTGLRLRAIHRIANQPEIKRAVQTGSYAGVDAALDSLRLATDSIFAVVVFDAEGRAAHYLGVTAEPEQISRVTPLLQQANMIDSSSINSPFFEFRGRGHFWTVAAIKEGDRTLGHVAQLRVVRTNANAARTLQSLIGPENRILFANIGDARTPWVELEGVTTGTPTEEIIDEDGWRYRQGDKWYIAGRDSIRGTPWEIIVASPESLTQARPQQFLRRTGLLGLLLLVSATAIVWIASRRITQPIRRLNTAAGAIGHGRLDERVDISRRDELGELGRSFNQMAAEVQRSMQAVQESQAEAERANRAKSEFLASMSHEIRTPINAILGYTDLMDFGVAGEVSEQQRNHLERIRVSGNHLVGLINDLLDFARIETARLSVEREIAPADDAIQTALTVVSPQAASKSIELQVECEQGARYVGDRQRVEQILVNLLGNAIKFTPDNGTISLDCRTVNQHGTRHVQFTVTDTGIGIPPDRLEAIFEPFVQAKGGYTRTHGGTGLGLSISRRLAELMGGEIAVTSKVDAGSRFTLTLPAPA